MLTELFTSIAEAIRTKKGTTDKIKASDFPTEIANLPSGGDTYEVARNVANKTITEYVDTGTLKINEYFFSGCKLLTKLHVPNATELGSIALKDCVLLEDLDISSVERIGNYAFDGTKLITELNLPNCKTLGTNPFGNQANNQTYSSYVKKLVLPSLKTITGYTFGASSSGQRPLRLKYIDCGTLANIPTKSFYGSYADSIILRKSDSVCTLANVDAFTGSYIANGNGYVYVPKALIEEYKVATNWATYSNQFRAIEDWEERIDIIIQPTNVEVAVGGTIICTVVADGMGIEYQWQRSTDNGTTWSDISGTSSTYTTTAQAKYNGWKLRCVITNINGNTLISDEVLVTII